MAAITFYLNRKGPLRQYNLFLLFTGNGLSVIFYHFYLYGLPGMASQACVGLSLGIPRVVEVAAESEQG